LVFEFLNFKEHNFPKNFGNIEEKIIVALDNPVRILYNSAYYAKNCLRKTVEFFESSFYSV